MLNIRIIGWKPSGIEDGDIIARSLITDVVSRLGKGYENDCAISGSGKDQCVEMEDHKKSVPYLEVSGENGQRTREVAAALNEWFRIDVRIVYADFLPAKRPKFPQSGGMM